MPDEPTTTATWGTASPITLESLQAVLDQFKPPPNIELYASEATWRVVQKQLGTERLPHVCHTSNQAPDGFIVEAHGDLFVDLYTTRPLPMRIYKVSMEEG